MITVHKVLIHIIEDMASTLRFHLQKPKKKHHAS